MELGGFEPPTSWVRRDALGISVGLMQTIGESRWHAPSPRGSQGQVEILPGPFAMR